MIAGEFGDGDGDPADDPDTLDDAGERIRLIDNFDRLVLDFTYSAGGGWPGRAAGLGSSLEVLDTTASYSDPGNWLSSIAYGGTPGQGRGGPRRRS